MSGPDLANYVEVNERIAAFFDKYPEGSLQRQSFECVEVGSQTFLVFKAAAYRTPDDTRPGEGTAWEPVPGKTPFTKDSELQNAETSAWGRALAALGFEVKRGVATKEDVEARQNGAGDSDEQKQALLLLQEANFADPEKKAIGKWGFENGQLRPAAAKQIVELLADDVPTGAEKLLMEIGYEVPADG